MKKILSLLLCVTLLFSFTACNPRFGERTESFEAMDTYMTMTAYNVSAMALSGIRANIEWLDRNLSVTNADDSEHETFVLNRDGSALLSEQSVKLIEQALALCAETDGALDISVAPLVSEWGFYSDEHHVPTQERLAELLPLVDYRKVKIDGERVTLEQPGMMVDFGAVAKGYAADLAVDILRKEGTDCAILNLGGTIAAVGEKRGGVPWKIGVADPDNSATFMGYLSCRDKIIATSGSYERCFTAEDGKTYSHIIDPKTGVPVDNDLLSVTIISESGLRSDGLSTALFVMGREKAEQYRQAHPDFDYVMLTKDKKAYVTEGAAESFTLADGYDYEVVKV